MPNHVRTVIKISKLKKDDIDIVLNLLASPMTTPTEKTEYAIDFNKIIPEPEFESDCPNEYKVNKYSRVELREDKPWFNWYKWHVDQWGTKWGAYDCYTKIGKSYVQFVFSTAWSVAHPIIAKLSLLGHPVEVKFADEDYGSNCGIITWSREQGWEMKSETSLKDPVRFARDLWARY